MARINFLAFTALFVASCGGGGGGDSPAPPAPPAPPAVTYSVGGSVTGLGGTGLVLQNNGADPLPIAADGAFTFPTQAASGSAYNVSVRTHPTSSPAQLCDVANATGLIGSAAVTTVTVTCRAATGRYLYSTSTANKTVSAFSINRTTGALTEIVGSPFAVNGASPRASAVDKSGKFLFIAGANTVGVAPSTLTGYVIDSATGALSAIPGLPIDYPATVGGFMFHPSGRYLYVPLNTLQPVSSTDNGLYAYTINATTGALTPVPGSPYRFAQDAPPRIGAFNAAGTMLLVPSGFFNVSGPVAPLVTVYSVDAATGALAVQSTAGSNGIVNEIALHPGGKFAYTRMSDGSVGLLDVTNPLAPVGPTSAASAGFGLGIAFDKTAQYGYFLNNGLIPGPPPPAFGPGSMFGFRIDSANGALTPLAGSPYPTNGDYSVLLAVDPLYRYLVATNVGAASQTVTAFAIDAVSGTLAHVPGSPFSPTVGALPLGVTFDPSGQFAYLPDAQTSSISAYRIGANGVLTFVGSYAIGASPLAVARVAGLQ